MNSVSVDLADVPIRFRNVVQRSSSRSTRSTSKFFRVIFHFWRILYYTFYETDNTHTTALMHLTIGYSAVARNIFVDLNWTILYSQVLSPSTNRSFTSRFPIFFWSFQNFQYRPMYAKGFTNIFTFPRLQLARMEWCQTHRFRCSNWSCAVLVNSCFRSVSYKSTGDSTVMICAIEVKKITKRLETIRHVNNWAWICAGTYDSK